MSETSNKIETRFVIKDFYGFYLSFINMKPTQTNRDNPTEATFFHTENEAKITAKNSELCPGFFQIEKLLT